LIRRYRKHADTQDGNKSGNDVARGRDKKYSPSRAPDMRPGTRAGMLSTVPLAY